MKKFLFAVLGIVLWTGALYAQTPPVAFNVDLNAILQPEGFTNTVNLLLAVSVITLIPFFLISTTSFLRILIVLGMIRSSIGTQQSPPNSVIVSLALFMTIFVMTPTFNEVNVTAIKPYQDGKITQKEAWDQGIKPFKTFMLKMTREKDLALFIEFSQIKKPKNIEDVPIFVLIPSFIISELKTAFQIGFLLYIPFLVIDMIVSNILLSLGMFMLSPAMISTPFKILLFVLTDGWNLVTQGLLLSFKR